MPKSKAVQKPSNGSSIQGGRVNSVRLSDVEPTPLQPVSIEVPGTTELTLQKTRIDALEFAIASLICDVSRMKQMPTELVAHQSKMNRLEERLNTMTEDLQRYAVEIIAPVVLATIPKKRWGIF